MSLEHAPQRAGEDRLGDDLLKGGPAIAHYLNATLREVYHLVARNELPTFKVGRTLYARRSELRARFSSGGGGSSAGGRAM